MKKQETNLVAKVVFPLLLSGLVIFWGFKASAEEWTEAQKEIWKTVEAGWDLIIKGDLEALSASNIESAFEWWADDPAPFGSNFMKGKYRSWFNWNKPVSYELKPVAINIVGDVSTVFYHFKWKGDKFPDSRSGRQFEVFIKQDGKWKFLGSMGCPCDQRPFCLE